jgi:putative polymerase
MTATALCYQTARRLRFGDAIGKWLAPVITSVAVLYNFLLCFVNTNLHGIGPSIVISTEIALIGMALGLVWNRSYTLYVILLLLAAYFYTVMLIRFELDPIVLRNVLIPIAFYFLGRHFGSVRTADRLVLVLLAIALGVALWEWLALNTYFRYFNVSDYYIARGTADLEDQQRFLDYFQGFFNSTRFDNRTLLPFLGNHRVSGIFLEAPSVGNFGAIVFAWTLLRPHRISAFIARTVAILMIIVLADSRFGLYFCVIEVLIYALSPVIRPTALFVAPFLMVLALLYVGVVEPKTIGNDIAGRFVLAGHILTSIDPAQVFGLEPSGIKSGVRFAMNEITDSAYAYVLVEIGIIGAALLWGLFVYAPVPTRDAWRFKTIVAFYYVLLMTVAASPFTIKTAALLWFLFGTLNNNEPQSWPIARVFPTDLFRRRAGLFGGPELPPMDAPSGATKEA